MKLFQDIIIKRGDERFRFSNHKIFTNIYGLISKSRPNEIKYIGKADCLKKRFNIHCRDAIKKVDGKYVHNLHKYKWIRKILRNNEELDIVLIAWVPYKNWKILEDEYINLFRENGHKLTNEASGGQGGFISKEAHQRAAKNRKLYYEKNKNTEKVIKELERARQQTIERNKLYVGSGNPNYNNKWSDEKKEVARQQQLGKKASELTKKKQKKSAANKNWITNGIQNTKLKKRL